jgi:membrane associated rhomboid family serine protease
MLKIFWEFPLTLITTIFLFFFYIFVNQTLPHTTIATYFYSYPGKFSFINWILSSFYHSSFSHLFSNMLFLYFLGRAAESKISKSKWILFYLSAGLISMMFDSFFRGFILHERIPAVGASGAISGISAVAMVYSPLQYRIFGINFFFPVFLIAWLMIYLDFMNLFSSDNIAHFAHLAGFFSVLLTSYLFSDKEREKLRNNFFLNLLFFIFTIILLFFLENR